jgi:dTMP kinase
MILRNFAVLEGADGSGTTTQLKMLERRFVKESALPPLFASSEPTGGSVGVLVRRVLKGEEALRGDTLARLFAADRGEHLYAPDGVVERCRRGELAVSDRYSLSSLVYQAIDCGAELPQSLNSGFPLPELLIYIDLDSETALRRISSRQKLEIFERLEFQKKVREGYRALLPVWERAGVRVVIIDGTLSPEEAGNLVWSAVSKMPIMKQ